MNRRKAIGQVLLTGAVGAGLFSGYKWYDWHKTPDFGYLRPHRATIAALAETIIPTDDTPGAGQAGVPDFIIKYVLDCESNFTANKFIDGLKELDSHTRSKYGNAYEECSAEEQVSILQYFEQKGKMRGIAGKARDRYLGKPFFALLKEYTVKGYGASEAGASRAMAYVPVPGSYHGCIPLTPGQKSWATR